jgi:N-acyl-D-amino-acid deacylase
VEPGYRADLTVFDPERVADTATYSRPISPAAGIASVWVSGVETWHDGEPTGARAGQVIRRH